MRTLSGSAGKKRMCYFTIIVASLSISSFAADGWVSVQSVNQQMIQDWGCFPGWAEWSAEMGYHNGIAQTLYKDLGMTVARIRVYHEYGADAQGNLNMDKMNGSLKPYLTKMKECGMNRYIACSWSPPLAMRLFYDEKPVVNGQKNVLKAEYEDAYVRFIVAWLKYFRDNGFSLPIAYSLQNEGYATPPWDDCPIDNDQFYRLCKKLRKAFDDNGMQSIQIMGGDDSNWSESLWRWGGEGFPNLSNDAELRSIVKHISFHNYWTNTASEGDIAKFRSSTLKARSQWGMRVWQTESSLAGWGADEMKEALNNTQLMIRDIGYFGADSWVYWLGWRYQGGGTNECLTYCTSANQSNPPPVSKVKLYYVLQKLWNIAKPGHYVRLCDQSNSGLDAFSGTGMNLIAFARDGFPTVVLLCNFGGDRTLDFRGLTGTRCTVYRTSGGENMSAAGTYAINSGTASNVGIQGNSVNILVTNNSGGTFISSELSINRRESGLPAIEVAGNAIMVRNPRKENVHIVVSDLTGRVATTMGSNTFAKLPCPRASGTMIIQVQTRSSVIQKIVIGQ